MLHVAENGNWKKAFWVFAIFMFVVMPMISNDYGQSGDEWLQIEYGRDIYNYFFGGDKQALDYTNKSLQYQGIEFYGGIFDFYMEILHRWFPSIPILALRHFFNALFGATLMLFTGLMARRLSKKWAVGLLAMVFLFFSPRIFGESMNNPKDIPFACGFMMALYGLIALIQDLPQKLARHSIILGIGFAIAFGVRPAGGVLFVAYIALFVGGAWFLDKGFRQQLFADNNKLLKRLAAALVLPLIAGYITGLFAWPWGLQEPLSNVFVSLQKMSNIEIQLRVLFEGTYGINNNMPWYYEFKWMLISNPIIILAGTVAYFALLPKLVKTNGLLLAGFPVFCALFPPLYIIYKHSSVHDTWRHMFFVYPNWVIMSAISFGYISDMIKSEKAKLVPYGVAILGLVPAIVWTVRSHPNQYVYFNELEGGAKGAYGYYDLDYYQNSGKQAADWLLKNAKRIPGRKVLVRSNMVGFDKYFAKDTSWIVYDYGRYNDRHTRDWDYYVAYPRYLSAEMMQNDAWKLQNTVHAVTADGAPLCLIIKRASTAGIAANEALNNKDYATAAQKYAEYIATDTTDEYAYLNYGIALASMNQMEPAIVQVNKAIKIDPANAQFYSILAQLYAAAGNMQAAQQAKMRSDELVMAEQGE